MTRIKQNASFGVPIVAIFAAKFFRGFPEPENLEENPL